MVKKRLWQYPTLLITLVYAAFGLVWILVTDWLLFAWVRDPARLVQWQMAKGWLFVLASTLIIFTLLLQARRRQRATLAALADSEARFRRAVNEAPYPMIIHAEDGEILLLNRAWTEITGYTPEEIPTVGAWVERAYGAQQAEVLDGIKQLFSLEDRITEGDYPVICKDGTQRIWEFSTTPLGPLPDGRRSIISMAADVTARIEAEAALREKKAVLDGYFTNTLDLLCIADMDGRFLHLNKAWEMTLGYPLDELEGQYYLNFVHPDDDHATRDAMAQLASAEPVLNFVNRYQHRDGSYRWIEWRTVPADNLVYGSARDVTRRVEREERLRLQDAALQAAASAIVITDRDGVIQWANPAFAQLTGYALDETLGKNPRELVKSGIHSPRFYEALWETILQGDIWRGEIVNRRKDGTLYTEEASITPVRDESGEITHFVAIKLDITDRKKAREERERLLAHVRAQTEEVLQIIQTVPEGVLLLNRDGRILIANPRAEAYLALLSGARIGGVLTHLGERELAAFQTSPPPGQWHVEEVNGRTFHILARAVEAGPANQGWVFVLRDVTEQQAVQRQLQRQERLAAIGQLAAGIAHDFNNIMAVISLYAQLLAQSIELSSTQQARLKTIEQQSNRAAQLIQQILDFSRRTVLERQPLDLHPLLKEQVKLLQRTLPEHILIQLDAMPVEYIVQADPTRIQQTIMNLAVNARDAMPEGGQLRFTLAHELFADAGRAPLPDMAAGSWIRLSVADTGCGMATHVLDHVFEPFFTTKEPGQGTGLGLAQVHGIIAQHGGYIAVKSEVGVGSTFDCYLPALVLDTGEDDTADVPAAAMPRGQGELLLIVEDEATLREAMMEILEVWGYQVLAAANGDEALTLLKEHGANVALVLSDIIMPRMGGKALLHALRDAGWEMPVILLTGHPLTADPGDWRAQNVRATLSKPVLPAKLAQTVADVLRPGA
ncbi:MAG: PAS domain S-box protein [Anaerolineales bacterium]|nr:PAS domain S-box protein [Anaerolineales bacterium]